MDDHFWPAMYPGIIAGFLLGLGGGNVVSTILGPSAALSAPWRSISYLRGSAWRTASCRS